MAQTLLDDRATSATAPVLEPAVPQSFPLPQITASAGILAAARTAGREHLLETEGLAIVRSLGVEVPLHVCVNGFRGAREIDLSAFPGDKVVIKVVSDTILHKSDAGGVAVVPKDRGAVMAAIQEMEQRLASSSFSINEFIPHDAGLGGEILLGMRWTDDFGPVVTLGPGGVYAEFLAANLRPGCGTAILSPAFASPRQIAAALENKIAGPLLTGRLRGQPARTTPAALRGLLRRALDFAAATMPHDITELEINPLVFTSRGPVALDALVRIGRGIAERPAAERPIDKIRNLLEPESIAVVGVSAKGNNPGRIVLRNVLAAGFDPARVFVVKPGCDWIDGCCCVPDIASLPRRVDLLVLAIDAAQVPAAVDEVIAGHKAESLIVIPGGLGEHGGSEGTVARLRSALAAERTSDWRGPVVNGGNCLGVRSVPGLFNTLFIPEHKLRFPDVSDVPAAPLAVLSQSGAFAITRAGGLASLNPRYLISYGNQLDLTIGDYLTWLAHDPAVDTFACYVEGFQPLDGRRFLAAAAEITASGRTVILYRAGRTAAGAKATASHTASIAGDYAVTRELANAAGVLLADALDDFEDLVRLSCQLRAKRIDGWHLAAVSNAGFECVALADHLGRFQLPAFCPETEWTLAGLFATHRLDTILDVHNPLDVSPILNDEGWEIALRAVLADPVIDVGLFGCVPLTGALATVPAGPGHDEDLTRPGAIADRLARLFAESSKAWVTVIDGGSLYDPLARLLTDRGVPVFRTMDRAMRMLEIYCGWRLSR